MEEVIERFLLTEQETIVILRKFGVIELGFGPVGAWLEWDTSKPIPEAVRYLGLLRGVLNENTEGAGI